MIAEFRLRKHPNPTLKNTFLLSYDDPNSNRTHNIAVDCINNDVDIPRAFEIMKKLVEEKFGYKLSYD